jgi:type IV pilus assembly protein PilA
MTARAFTLIELLVVVAIIGILAAIGVTTFSGFTGSAKINATKSNHALVVKYITSETKKCEIGATYVMETSPTQRLTCSGRTVNTVATYASSALVNIKVPYDSQYGAVSFENPQNTDNDLGRNRLYQGTSASSIVASTCFDSPCSSSSNVLKTEINF